MGLWSERIVPRLSDVALRGTELDDRRAETCAGLTGRVLEVGFGSGLNIRCYPPEIGEVVAVEPADAAWRLSAARRAAAGVPVVRGGLDGQRLTQADDSFDSALVTFSLCTIPDPALALAEVRRVLRPGGALHFLEHGLAPDPRVARWQRRLDPVQSRVFAGCHLSRDVPRLVAAAGLAVQSVQAEYLPGPAVSRPWCYGYLGRALAPA